MDKTPRTWFVTGVNRGLGRHLLEHLLASGDRVAGTARDLAPLAELRARYGERLWLAELDLTDVARIRSVVDQAFAALGRIDVVVSNAATRCSVQPKSCATTTSSGCSTPTCAGRCSWRAPRYRTSVHKEGAASSP